jgi:hypothetical protein
VELGGYLFPIEILRSSLLGNLSVPTQPSIRVKTGSTSGDLT